MTQAPKSDTRFKPGNPGGPGRKRGSRNKLTVIAERLTEAEADEIVQSVISAAKAGDMQAAKLIFDRLYPIRRGSPVTFELPRIVTATDVDDALSAVVYAVSEGTLTPEEGASVAGLIETRRKAIETVDLEARISKIEAERDTQ